MGGACQHDKILNNMQTKKVIQFCIADGREFHRPALFIDHLLEMVQAWPGLAKDPDRESPARLRLGPSG
ncbi:MAG: hypothetical protein METHAR1v1_960023 [Methanothrix sp.]|nr:MAG: hypothetical protein METHAR1v1_960023 [Methanothrix sp.]